VFRARSINPFEGGRWRLRRMRANGGTGIYQLTPDPLSSGTVGMMSRFACATFRPAPRMRRAPLRAMRRALRAILRPVRRVRRATRRATRLVLRADLLAFRFALAIRLLLELTVLTHDSGLISS